MSQSTLPILIIGAGISGLALAQGLLKACIPFRVFERDPGLTIPVQGYRVRINGTGQAALEQILSPLLFSQLKASCADVINPIPANLDALTGECVENMLGCILTNFAKPLNVDRTVLRSVLWQGVEEYVEFGKEFSSYEITSTGVAVRFSDSSCVLGTLVVGADGSRSRVRKQLLPKYQLLDTEGRWIYGKTTLTPDLVENFNKRALLGMTLVSDRNEVPLSLLLEPMHFNDNAEHGELPKDYVYWVIGSRKDRFDVDEAHMTSLSAGMASRDVTSHFHPSFHSLIALQDVAQTSVLRIISARPEIPSWEYGRVTLIGDSIHLMSPTAGVGATTALRDAATLSQILSDEGINADSVGKYEALMRIYAGEAIKGSFRGGKYLFGMRPFDELKSVIV